MRQEHSCFQKERVCALDRSAPPTDDSIRCLSIQDAGATDCSKPFVVSKQKVPLPAGIILQTPLYEMQTEMFQQVLSRVKTQSMICGVMGIVCPSYCKPLSLVRLESTCTGLRVMSKNLRVHDVRYYLDRLKSCILATESGTGKTLVGLMAGLSFTKTVVVLNDACLEHWRHEALKHIVDARKYVRVISHKDDFTQAFPKTTRVTLICASLVPTFSFAKLPCNFLILDEAHTFGSGDPDVFHALVNKCVPKLLITSNPDNNILSMLRLAGVEVMSEWLNIDFDNALASFQPCEARRKARMLRNAVLKDIALHGRLISMEKAQTQLVVMPQDQDIAWARRILDRRVPEFESLKTERDMILGLQELEYVTDTKQLHALVQRMHSFNPAVNLLADTKEACSVCTEPFKNPFCFPVCGHVFCLQCLLDWRKTLNSNRVTCPMCRHLTPIASSADMIKHFGKVWCPPKDFWTEKMFVSKVCRQVETWLSCFEFQNRKLVLYTQFKAYAETFQHMLTRRGAKVSVAGFDGNKSNDFNKDFHALILNVKMPHTYTLPEVTDVVVSDFDSLIHVSQICKRFTIRLGSTALPPHVRVFVYEGSIQHWMMLKNKHLVQPLTKEMLELEYFMMHKVEGSRMHTVTQMLQQQTKLTTLPTPSFIAGSQASATIVHEGLKHSTNLNVLQLPNKKRPRQSDLLKRKRARC